MSTKFEASNPIYNFSLSETDGDASQIDLLGGKGANLAEMSKLGINVPPGFTITTEVCNYFMKNKAFPENLEEQIINSVKKLENLTGRVFNGSENLLLLSVRSGGRISMPGMMDSILNIGLNDSNVAILAKEFKDERFALDSYRRLIQMYSNVVLGLEHERFEAVIKNKKRMDGVSSDAEFNVEQLKWIINAYKNIIERFSKVPFPQDPNEQLLGAIKAVFNSWLNKRAISYRKINNIPDTWGTGATVQAMVYGNLNDLSGTGVAFTRNPSNGNKELYGEYLMNAQGEDVVAGIRTPLPISSTALNKGKSLEELFPESYKQIKEISSKLENHFKEVQDIEFTIQNKEVFLLQTRKAKRTAQASVKIAVDMAKENIVSKNEALIMVDANSITDLLHPQFEDDQNKTIFAKALNASPGAAVGEIVFDADTAEQEANKGRKVILVREETSPEDINGMYSSVGILTTKGGMTSHAAVVARGMGKPCIVGAENLLINYDNETISNGEITLNIGDLISLDGSVGEVYIGELKTQPPKPSDEFNQIMKWSDEVRRLNVRANAETVKDTKKALEFSAEGIGLCRTEHMFFEGERILPMREMIMAETTQGRKRALAKLIKFQIKDFEDLFEILEDKPITIRLLDPPMHEFLPKSDVEITSLANEIGILPSYINEIVLKLSESNPMLGHRGVRLGLSYPEIYKMQVEAICRAIFNISKSKKTKTSPEIMIPLIMNAKELQKMKTVLIETIQNLEKELKFNFTYSIGTMIELPSAALNSDEIAKHVDFFSFGTNDLTQTTLGLSRDDASKFLNEYVENGVFNIDPFVSIDIESVGKLVDLSSKNGKESNPKLKVGVCGEHAGEANSIIFLNSLNIDYISCSPFRIPTARLASAQAEIMNQNS
jgi:pyruvate,orthophosphate dikinase